MAIDIIVHLRFTSLLNSKTKKPNQRALQRLLCLRTSVNIRMKTNAGLEVQLVVHAYLHDDDVQVTYDASLQDFYKTMAEQKFLWIMTIICCISDPTFASSHAKGF